MNTFSLFFSLLDAAKFARGQNFDFNPPRHFQYITMDLLHRGSFNITDCARDLLNCWEVIKPDVICSRGTVHESLCGLLRRECHERYGILDAYEMPIFESLCRSYGYEEPT